MCFVTDALYMVLELGELDLASMLRNVSRINRNKTIEHEPSSQVASALSDCLHTSTYQQLCTHHLQVAEKGTKIALTYSNILPSGIGLNNLRLYWEQVIK